MPHDIVASEDKTVFVGDVHARTVWKFASTESMFFLFLMSHSDIVFSPLICYWFNHSDFSTQNTVSAEGLLQKQHYCMF